MLATSTSTTGFGGTTAVEGCTGLAAGVDVASIYSKTSSSVYLETEESVDQFVDALKAELKKIVGDRKRVRIR